MREGGRILPKVLHLAGAFLFSRGLGGEGGVLINFKVAPVTREKPVTTCVCVDTDNNLFH